MNSSSQTKYDITVVAADCLYPALAARALAKSKPSCLKTKSVLFSDKKIEGEFDFIKINRINSINDYNYFILRELHKFIETDFALIVQWDGYVVNENEWSDIFLDYDYTGAVWPQFSDRMNVGNGGFSLRSKKLLTATATDPSFMGVDDNEDVLICRTNRSLLESRYNIKFAPESVARQFSYEQETPAAKSFGFHGLGNIWRHETSDVILEILDQIRPSYYENYQMHSLLMHCYLSRNYRLFAYLYEHTTNRISVDLLSAILRIALKFEEREVRNMLYIGNLVKKLTKVSKYISDFNAT